MCTLIAFHGVWSDVTLVVATNRDEAYDRASAPPRWMDGEPGVLAPLDQRAGGTWMGVNARGLWVGVTNRRSGVHDDALRSRGLLCRELLDCGTAAEAVARLEALAEPYNPFHVVVADRDRLVLLEYEAGWAETRRLSSGCHVVTNRPFSEAAEEPKARRAWRLLYRAGLWPVERGARAPDDLGRRLAEILGDHGTDGADAVCIHGERHGTKSAAIWRISPPTAPGAAPGIALDFADGHPCTTPFESVPDGVDGPMAPG